MKTQTHLCMRIVYVIGQEMKEVHLKYKMMKMRLSAGSVWTFQVIKVASFFLCSF